MIPGISLLFVVISPFLFLILLVLVFSLFILVRFSRDLSILFIFSKNQIFVSMILSRFFLSLFHYFQPLFLLFLSICLFWVLLILVFLGVWDVALWCLFEIFLSFYLPLRTSFAVSHRFWEAMFSFSLASRNLLIFAFISSMTHWELSNVLLSLQLFVHFFAVAFVV
jgi:hypothetical protein